MKALILAGGRGSRINEFSENENKCMLGLTGRPLIEHSLESALSIKPKQIIIVVGYRAEAIINRYGNDFRGCQVQYVIQHEQHGLVHAIESSRRMLGEDDFMLLLGDELLFKPRHPAMLSVFASEKLMGICGVVNQPKLERISKTYSIVQDSSNRIYRLIEKPRKPASPIMGTGNCIFSNGLLDYLEKTPINPQRGEKELPDLIQCAVDDGHVVKSFLVAEAYYNINSSEDLLEAESRFVQGA